MFTDKRKVEEAISLLTRAQNIISPKHYEGSGITSMGNNSDHIQAVLSDLYDEHARLVRMEEKEANNDK